VASKFVWPYQRVDAAQVQAQLLHLHALLQPRSVRSQTLIHDLVRWLCLAYSVQRLNVSTGFLARADPLPQGTQGLPLVHFSARPEPFWSLFLAHPKHFLLDTYVRWVFLGTKLAEDELRSGRVEAPAGKQPYLHGGAAAHAIDGEGGDLLQALAQRLALFQDSLQHRSAGGRRVGEYGESEYWYTVSKQSGAGHGGGAVVLQIHFEKAGAEVGGGAWRGVRGEGGSETGTL